MKRFFFYSLFLLSLQVRSQYSLDWLKSYACYPTANSVATANNVEVGNDRSVYSTVIPYTLADSLGIDNSYLPLCGSSNSVVMKLDSLQQNQWSFSLCGFTIPQNGMTVDGAGNVIVAGTLQNLTGVDFNPDTTINTISATSSNHFIIAKYNTNGLYQWAFVIEAGAAIYISGIEADSHDNIYVAGVYVASGDPDFDPDTTIVVSTNFFGSYYCPFVAKYSSSGALIWLRSVQANSAHIFNTSLSIDSDNNVYYAGKIGSTIADFDGTGNDPNAICTNLFGAEAGYIVKYDSAGTFIWTHMLPSSGGCGVNDLAIAPNGHVFTIGQFNGQISFDTSFTSWDVSSGNYFVSGFNQLAQNSSWGFGVQYLVDAFITPSPSGHLLLSGNGSISDLNPGPAVFGVYNAAYVVTYNQQGQFLGGMTIPSMNNDNTYPYDLALTDTFSFVMAGKGTSNWNDFNPVAGNTVNTPYPNGCAFIGHYNGIPTSLNEISREFALSIYPNPFNSEINLSLYLAKPDDIVVTLINSLGQEVMVPVVTQGTQGTNYVNVQLPSELPAGMYMMRINSGGKLWTQSLVKSQQ